MLLTQNLPGVLEHYLGAFFCRCGDGNVFNTLKQQLRSSNPECSAFAPAPVGCQYQRTAAVTTQHMVNFRYGLLLAGGDTRKINRLCYLRENCGTGLQPQRAMLAEDTKLV